MGLRERGIHACIHSPRGCVSGACMHAYTHLGVPRVDEDIDIAGAATGAHQPWALTSPGRSVLQGIRLHHKLQMGGSASSFRCTWEQAATCSPPSPCMYVYLSFRCTWSRRLHVVHPHHVCMCTCRWEAALAPAPSAHVYVYVCVCVCMCLCACAYLQMGGSGSS